MGVAPVRETERNGRARSGRRVRPERDNQSREGAVSAPSRVWSGALTSGEQDASDTADGTMPAAAHAEPPKAASLLRRQRAKKRFERASRVASHESVQACGTVRRARCSERLADRGSLPK